MNNRNQFNLVQAARRLHRYAGTLRRQWRARREQRTLLADTSPESGQVGVQTWPLSLVEPTTFYRRCYRCFHRELPGELRAHRAYFIEKGRGFGEDAFHVMWWMLMREFRPRTFLEIGVYRGQTISLVSLLARQMDHACEVHGLSPFSSVGDSVSAYMSGLDYQEDTRANFRRFDLPEPVLHRAYSTDAAGLNVIASRSWDCIYIDGNHDYEVARADWLASSRAVRPGGLIVMDDSGITSSYEAPLFATRGHPGPSRVAAEIDRREFREILQVGHNRVFQRLDS